jgi:polyvinyl alcohol dehydrogenase (cytochrome)
MNRALPIVSLSLLGFIAVLRADETAASGGGSHLTDLKELEARTVAADLEQWPGAAIYKQHCQMCHEGQIPKAPHKMFLQMLSGPTIVTALNEGLMQGQAAALTQDQRKEVAEYLSAAPLSAARDPKPAPSCKANAARFDLSKPPLKAGWGYDNSRFVPAASAGLDAAGASKLRLKWAFAYPNALRARSQPHIAYGAIFVGSQDGTVYALDLKSGCVRWRFKASAEVRTAVVPYEAEVAQGARVQTPRVYFGDVLANLYSVEALTGKLRWRQKLDDHANATMTGTPTYRDGVLYAPVSSLEVTSAADPKYACCTFRGSVVALDAWSGERRWKSYTITEEPRPAATAANGTRVIAPSGAPVWNSPMVDVKRGVLYVGTGENYSSPADDRSDALLAFRLTDGKLLWSNQRFTGDAWNVGCMMKDNPNCPKENGPDVDFGAGTILITLPDGRDLLLAGQKNGFVFALDPDHAGALVWSARPGRGGTQGGVHFGMAAGEGRVYVPVSDMRDAHDGRPVVGPTQAGLHALDPATGKILWSTLADDRCGDRKFCDAGISAAATAIPGVVFAGHMDGRFRAYDSTHGKVLFEFNADRAIATVSGARAHGGSFGGGGPAVRDGYVVVNSGYGLYFHMPGNVLLVFSAR